eukprot:7844943-Alexandrium_andersonii.AAC.1
MAVAYRRPPRDWAKASCNRLEGCGKREVHGLRRLTEFRSRLVLGGRGVVTYGWRGCGADPPIRIDAAH